MKVAEAAYSIWGTSRCPSLFAVPQPCLPEPVIILRGGMSGKRGMWGKWELSVDVVMGLLPEPLLRCNAGRPDCAAPSLAS